MASSTRTTEAVDLSTIFTNDDVTVLNHASIDGKTLSRRKFLQENFVDNAVETILSSFDKTSVLTQLRVKLRKNEVPDVLIWSASETTFYRPKGSLADFRNQPLNGPGSATALDFVEEQHLNTRAYSPYTEKTASFSELLRISDLKFILASRFGSKFSVNFHRTLTSLNEFYHVYLVSIFICFHSDDPPSSFSDSVSLATAARSLRAQSHV
jgi:hypothetical protein